MDAATNAYLGFRNFAVQLFSEYLWTTASVFHKKILNSFIEKSINLLFSVITLNPLMAADNKNSYLLKQTGSFWMQVCLRKYDLLLSQDIKESNSWGCWIAFTKAFANHCSAKNWFVFATSNETLSQEAVFDQILLYNISAKHCDFRGLLTYNIPYRKNISALASCAVSNEKQTRLLRH